MEKKVDKKRVVKFAAGLLTLAFGIGSGVHIYDSNIDHLNEYCPLNNVFGAQHQVHEINNEYAVYGINAFYAENGEVQLASAPKKTEKDGKIVYTAPIGYELSNGQIVKNVGFEELEKDKEDAIVLTYGTPVYPEGTQPGDIIRKSDIQVYDPQVVKLIKANQENEMELTDQENDISRSR